MAKRFYREHRCPHFVGGWTVGMVWLMLFWIGVTSNTVAQPERGQIWLTGVDPIAAHVFGWPEPDREDYAGMFVPSAPWQHAAQNVRVFKMTAGVVLRMPPEVVSRIFADLKSRHIALAIEMAILAGKDSCGRGEGYAAPRAYELVARKVKELGGDLSYIAMDEPLWFGHQRSRPNACGSPIGEIAREVATAVGVLKGIFPAIKVGDIEPVGSPTVASWPNDIAEWMQAYRDAVGSPMPFFHADVVWTGSWREQLPQLASRVRSAGARFGIIYNGDSQDQSDEAWTHHAQKRMVEVETDLALIPDQAILQSWMPRPVHMLPETRAGTMTYLVNRYAATATIIKVLRHGDLLTGSLTDVTGNPQTESTMEVDAIDNGTTSIENTLRVSDVVPHGATHATIALRINTACNCSGPAQVGFGLIGYQDNVSGEKIQRTLGRPNKERIAVRAGEAVAQNTPDFPVTQGDTYTLEVPIRASHESTDSGFVAVIFMDQQNKQVANKQVWFKPSRVFAGNVTTDKDGNFQFLPKPDILSLHAGFLVEFPGDDRHRLSEKFVR